MQAFVTDKTTKEKVFLSGDSYTSKKRFAEDLRGNGYIVHQVYNSLDMWCLDNTDYTQWSHLVATVGIEEAMARYGGKL